MSKRLASPVEVAKYLAISKGSVHRLIAAGDITAIRIGERIVRIDLDEIDAKFFAVTE